VANLAIGELLMVFPAAIFFCFVVFCEHNKSLFGEAREQIRSSRAYISGKRILNLQPKGTRWMMAVLQYLRIHHHEKNEHYY
jgi:hypothetical protein